MMNKTPILMIWQMMKVVATIAIPSGWILPNNTIFGGGGGWDSLIKYNGQSGEIVNIGYDRISQKDSKGKPIIIDGKKQYIKKEKCIWLKMSDGAELCVPAEWIKYE